MNVIAACVALSMLFSAVAAIGPHQRSVPSDDAGLTFIAVQGKTPTGRKGQSDTAAFCRVVAIDRPVRKATWTMSGCGVFRAWLNGSEVGSDDFLKPGYTHARKRRHSFSYDVTDRLKDGRNVLAAEVSAGWW